MPGEGHRDLNRSIFTRICNFICNVRARETSDSAITTWARFILYNGRPLLIAVVAPGSTTAHNPEHPTNPGIALPA